MWWFVYAATAINLIVIWFMPKRLTRREIYVTWFFIVPINISVDMINNFYFHLYHLDGEGMQLRVHLIEWTLGPSYGIIFLNFMPQALRSFVWYTGGWVAYSVLFEWVTVHLHFLTYTGWKLWYSLLVYIAIFLLLRWHIRYIRKTP